MTIDANEETRHLVKIVAGLTTQAGNTAGHELRLRELEKRVNAMSQLQDRQGVIISKWQKSRIVWD